MHQGVDFGSVVEHWIFNQAACVQIPPKSWDIFSLICYALFFVTLSCLKKCDKDHLYKFLVSLHPEASHKIWFQMTQMKNEKKQHLILKPE